MLPEDAMMCRNWSTKAIDDTLFLARTFLTDVGIMSQCWCLCRLGPWEHKAMSKPFLFMFTVPIQRNCSLTAAQTVTPGWMPLVSVILFSFHVSTKTIIRYLCNMYAVLPINYHHRGLGPGSCKCGLEYRSASCCSEQTDTVLLCWEQVLLAIPAALCFQRCHGTLVYIWFPLRLCLTTSRPHIWSSGRHWLSPSIFSWLLSLPGELKGERKRRRE